MDDRDEELHGSEDSAPRSGCDAVYDAAAGARARNPAPLRPARLENAVPASVDRPAPLEALAAGVAATLRGADLDEGLGSLLAAGIAALDARSAMVSLQDPDRPAPELALTVGLDEAAQAAAVAAVADPSHPLTAAGRDRAESRAGATVGLPLIASRAGIEEPLGAIALTFASEADATAADPTFLQLVADVAALAVDRSRLAATAAERSEWFERLANTDPLTGLANQRTILRVLELELTRAGRQGGEVSVAVFDVDDFAATNEASGRDAGDDVLRSVAAVLAGSVRLVDTVARFGGDEFLLVAPGSAGATVTRRVLDGIADLPPIAGRTITITAGVARFPDDGTGVESLIAAAQAALDRARDERRGTVETTEAGS
ncbi:MAG: GGDEF domain-containing protein [Chloroflexi bacterium]|nr:MAG: GGDEF domain-containing protein [Chloroflexota bacterium]